MNRPAPTAAQVAQGLADHALSPDYNEGCEMVVDMTDRGDSFVMWWEPGGFEPVECEYLVTVQRFDR